MLAVIVCCALVSLTNGARILGVFTTPSYSHQVVFQPIWRELSLRGHEVTVLTPNPLRDPSLTNLTEIDLSYSYKQWNDHGIASLGTVEHSSSDEIQKISDAYFAVSEVQLQDPQVQSLINRTNSEHFDLILAEFLWPTMYAFKDIYDCPMVGIASLGLTATANEAMGNPRNPALEPEFTLPFSTNLSFKERAISTIFRVLFQVGTVVSLRPRLEALSHKYFGDVRPLSELAKETSLVIVNSNLAIHNVKPNVPAIVEISGIHIQKPKELPSDLKKWLDDAKEGVVYFSLGSNVKSKQLPKEHAEKIMNAFAQLPYKVLWKFENDHLPNKPANVEIRKWLPQQDLLGHSNIKLFISQGGIQSIDEAIHHKVPVLTIPFFGDQRYNSHHLQESGAGLSINFHDFTTDELVKKIKEMITNPTYKAKVSKLSEIATDQPMEALQKAVWWIEYVLRHDGAEHLRYSAIDMPLYQYFLLDVIAFIALVLYTVLYALRYVGTHIIPCYHFFAGVLLSLNLTKKSHME